MLDWMQVASSFQEYLAFQKGEVVATNWSVHNLHLIEPYCNITLLPVVFFHSWFFRKRRDFKTLKPEFAYYKEWAECQVTYKCKEVPFVIYSFHIV